MHEWQLIGIYWDGSVLKRVKLPGGWQYVLSIPIPFWLTYRFETWFVRD